MGKILAVYIKEFKNKDDHKYIYGEELDDYISRLTGASEWESIKTYKDKVGKDNGSSKLKAYNRMIKKAIKSEFDAIATYSISLFGKNRDEALGSIKKLVESGLELFFFHEGIKIPSKEGNAYIKLLNKLSADESMKYSLETKRQVKKSFQKGRVHTPTTYFLGYDTDENGDMVINEEEAAVVRRIFKDFLSGKGSPTIAKELSKEKVKTARGNTNWTDNAVYKIIKQEKYYGVVKTQKSVTLEPYTHKRVINRGNQTQYLIRNNHPAIISEEMFLKAKRELKNRSKKRKKGEDGIISTYSNTSAYSNIFTCGECDRPVIRRTLTSRRKGEKYHFKAWQCRVAAGREKDLKCTAQYVWEEELNKSLREVFTRLKKNKDSIAPEVEGKQTHPKFTNEENKSLKDLKKKLNVINDRIKKIADSKVLGKDIAYEESLDKMTEKREKMNKFYEKLKQKKYIAKLGEKQLDILMEELEKFDPENSNVEDIFSKTVEEGILFNNHRLKIKFKCGIVREFTAEKSR